MGLPFASIGFGVVAGVLSVLSPCLLPLLPLVFGPAAAAHRLGPGALTAGLVASFVGVGLFVAMVGFSVGLARGRVALGARARGRSNERAGGQAGDGGAARAEEPMLTF